MTRSTTVFRLPILALSVMALAGCSSALQNRVRDRASFDLDCPKEQLRITEIEDPMLYPGTWGAAGCGKHATYVRVKGQIVMDANGSQPAAPPAK